MEIQKDGLHRQFQSVRDYTLYLCQPLENDDFQVQSIVQTSPPKWHIAHMTWFFETFVLRHFNPEYTTFHSQYDYLFNSYYYTHGSMHPRPDRGLLSRPTLDEILQYRTVVDEQVMALLHSIDPSRWQELQERILLGLNHEQQHQELLLMDIKHNFFANPLQPAYRDDLQTTYQQDTRPVNWVEVCSGLVQVGFDGGSFAFDNEKPRHPIIAQGYKLADRFVTNGEYLEFIDDGGYSNPELWLSDGWSTINQNQWSHPLYWTHLDGEWYEFTLGGKRLLNLSEPLAHLSYYEANAYACWAGKRLPLEYELEHVIQSHPVEGNFADSEFFHPRPANGSAQWFGDLWAWTASPYTAYPGFKPLGGSLGEYNGKFMSNQMVLKGGCCATPKDHARASYRNFFYPNERWAFTGLRLAEDLE